MLYAWITILELIYRGTLLLLDWGKRLKLIRNPSARVGKLLPARQASTYGPSFSTKDNMAWGL